MQIRGFVDFEALAFARKPTTSEQTEKRIVLQRLLILVQVIVFYVRIVKTLFNIQVILPTSLPKPKRRKELRKEKEDLN